jgi:hypothetical protein
VKIKMHQEWRRFFPFKHGPCFAAGTRVPLVAKTKAAASSYVGQENMGGAPNDGNDDLIPILVTF